MDTLQWVFRYFSILVVYIEVHVVISCRGIIRNYIVFMLAFRTPFLLTVEGVGGIQFKGPSAFFIVDKDSDFFNSVFCFDMGGYHRLGAYITNLVLREIMRRSEL